jgi:hypothetical protein
MRQALALTILAAAIGVSVAGAACSKSKSDQPAPAAANPAQPTENNNANPANPAQPPAFTAPAVDCAQIFPADEANTLCGIPVTMQVLPDEARGRTHPVTCSRAFMAANGARLSFRIQTDPRGDADNNVKAFNAEARFPRSWENVEAVAGIGDGARKFLQHGRALKGPMAAPQKGGGAPGVTPTAVGNASRHVRAVKGFWKISVEATSPSPNDADIICSFDQLTDEAKKIVSRLP